MLFWTGMHRNSESVLIEQEKNHNKNRNVLSSMKSTVNQFINLIKSKKSSLNTIGNLLDENWELKKQLADNVSNKFINTYPNFFNSKLSVQLSERERHDRLGPKKNKFYKLSKAKFIKKFVHISNKKVTNTKLDILKNLHIAYDLLKQKKKQCVAAVRFRVS